MSTARTDTGLAREPGEPAWTEVNVWPWVLRAVLAVRDVLRLAPFQYLAAVLFVAATAGLIITLSFLTVLVIVLPAEESNQFAKALGENLITVVFAAPALWMIPAALFSVFRRRPGIPVALRILRAMGAPARESTKAWDIFFRPLDRFLSGPVRWLLSRPRRLIYLAVLATPAVLLFTAGLLAPMSVIPWIIEMLMEVGKRTTAVGLIAMLLIYVVASIVYGALVFYVWLRSVLAALPMIALFVMAFMPELAFLAPVVQLVGYVPAGLASLLESGSSDVSTDLLLRFFRVFVGSPGMPSTVGMIMTGILLGWLPHLLEVASRPTPRERTANYGWRDTIVGAMAERGFHVAKSAVWCVAMVILVFGAPALILFIQDDLIASSAWIAVIPGLIGAALIVWIIRRAAEDGYLRGDPNYRFDVHEPGSSPAPDLGYPDYYPYGGMDDAFSALDRLLSEAERHQGTTMQRPKADLVEQD